MFILPFTHKLTEQNNFKVFTIKLLTIGGTQLWEENNSLHIDTDILNPNDIYRKGDIMNVDKKLKLCEIDTTKTNITDFYKWDELKITDTDTFCWRNYIYLMGPTNESWLTTPKTEKIGTYSIQDIIDKILHQCTNYLKK
jgi:hypothetical protein